MNTVRRLAILLSFGVGFLSLSQEIVWVRIVSLGQQGRPHAFSMVLVAFLVGIALGSMIGRRVCERSTQVLRAGGWCLIVAAAADLASLYLCSTRLVANVGSPRLVLALLALVGLGAALKGILFPIVHHLGTQADDAYVGRSVSHVYLANVLGSTLGPIATGFWLLDLVSLETVFGLIALGTGVLGVLALGAAGVSRTRAAWFAPAAVLSLAVMFTLRPPGVVARIVANNEAGTPVKHVLQNKYGVIHVLAEDAPGTGDITFGGNAYDGRINVDTRVNSNAIDRAYMTAVLHPNPRRVLVVGMSTGAWSAVILGIPGVERMDIVEINPGYLEVVRRYPDVAPVLRDPRVNIHIDDGRRWLRAQPRATYDLIFQNTTFHWRAYSTLLLSQEYLRELDSHLAEGGIVAMNTTGSLDVFQTAASVFPNVARHKNFVYMSKATLTKRADAESVLRQSRVWDRAAFDASAFAPGQIGVTLANEPLETAQAYLARTTKNRAPRVISDLNMVTEYRHGTDPPFAWLRPLLPADTGGLRE